MELITVVIPVYNVLPYLEQCVASVRNQSHSQLEILLIDDGSTDGSEEMCDRYAREDPRIRVIHQKNQGLGAARNQGIHSASGDYLLFVDSDDWICRTMAEDLYQTLISHQAQMAICDADVVTGAGRPIKTLKSNLPAMKVIRLEELPQLMFVPHVAWNKLYRKDLFLEEGCLYPPRDWYEDFCVTTKLYTKASRIVYLNRSLYCYRTREGSIQNNKDLSRRREKMKAMDEIIGYYRSRGLYQTYHDELEFLAVLNIYYYPSIELIQTNPDHSLIQEFSQYIRLSFPSYLHNPYLSTLNRRERFLFHLLNTNYNKLLQFILCINHHLKKCSSLFTGNKSR